MATWGVVKLHTSNASFLFQLSQFDGSLHSSFIGTEPQTQPTQMYEGDVEENVSALLHLFHEQRFWCQVGYSNKRKKR